MRKPTKGQVIHYQGKTPTFTGYYVVLSLVGNELRMTLLNKEMKADPEEYCTTGWPNPLITPTNLRYKL